MDQLSTAVGERAVDVWTPALGYGAGVAVEADDESGVWVFGQELEGPRLGDVFC